jgi:hypothetical protein
VWKYLCLLLSFGLTAAAAGEDARDQDIFGAPSAEQKVAPETDMNQRLLDTLQIGGRLEIRTDSGHKEGVGAAGGDFGKLKQADVYFDSRPNKDLRGFLRLRFSEGGSSGGAPAITSDSINKSDVCSSGCIRSDLDEMWLKWDIAKKVYATFGKQHLRWGSGRFWNPTDFTSIRVIDPLALFDRRLGVDMLKLHLPFEKQGYNLYAILLYGSAKQIDQLTGALRGEFAFGGIGEAAISFQMASHAPIRFGLDISSGVGPVDVHSESALTKRQSQVLYRGGIDTTTGQLPTAYREPDKWFVQSLLGVDRSFKYNSDDVATVGVEYFYNQLGYDDRNLELYSLVTGQSPTLYGGRRYIAGYLNLPAPGSWDDTSFFITGLRNLSDDTSTARLTGSWKLFKDADIQAFVAQCHGDFGELCFRIPSSFRGLASLPQVSPQLQQAVQALPTKRTLTTAGAGVVLKF